MASGASAQSPLFSPESAFDWSGFYAGIGGGGSWQSYDYDDGAAKLTFSPSLYHGELVLGGNVQLDSVVVGLEVSGGAYGLSGSGRGDLSPLFPDDYTGPSDIAFGVESSGYTVGIEARLGVLVTPRILLYGSAGANAIYSHNATTLTYTDPVDGQTTETLEHFGNVLGTIGAGLEIAVSDNISVDLAYKYGISAIEMANIPELKGFSLGAHSVSAQVLFHF